MKKVAVVVLAFALFLIALAVAPVMADSERKIDNVTATRTNSKDLGGDSRQTPGEVAHFYDYHMNASVSLAIPGLPSVSGTMDEYGNAGMVFPRISDSDSVQHKQGWGIWHIHQVWTFPTGTFEGTSQIEMTAPKLSAFEGRIVLHGTDAYEGWKLVLTCTKVVGGSTIWEGYAMIK